MQRASTGFTLWLTGLSGAGKSTIAQALARTFAAAGRRTEILDGDEIRATISDDLGFSPADRDRNIRRIGFIARLLSRNDVIVIAAAISPSRDGREEVRRLHDAAFLEVFVDCPIDELKRRDTKGLYAKATQGLVANMTGVSAPYEPPMSADVHLRTDLRSPEDCVAEILATARQRGLWPA